MGFVNGFYNSEFSYLATIQRSSRTFVNGVLGDPVWTDVATAPCIYWIGGASDRILSEQQRAEVSAIVMFDPEDVPAIEDEDRIIINGKTYYVIMSNDIAAQGQAIQVYLAEDRTA